MFKFFRRMTDIEILEKAISHLKTNTDWELRDAFNPCRYPWLSQKRVVKLYYWVDSLDCDNMFYFLGIIPTKEELQEYNIGLLNHLIEEIRNENV